MNYSIVTPPTDAELEAFLPLARVRGLCFVNNTRQDATLADYRRAAFDDGMEEARASFLPQTVRAIFRTPYCAPKNFGLEAKVVDPDGVQRALLLPRGPVISIASVKFMDDGGQEAETIDPTNYALESGRFLRWGKDFTWGTSAPRPNFVVEYLAGHPADHPKLGTLRVAVGEVIAAKWDAQGGTYVMPTTAKRAFIAMRKSRTYIPGA